MNALFHHPLVPRHLRALPLLGGALSAALLLPACGLREDDEFRNGVPTRETVELQLPGSELAAQKGALTGPDGLAGAKSALLGEEADMYRVTRDATRLVNGATAAVLVMVRTIVAFPATSHNKDMAVWGPHSGALDKNAWMLTVTRVEKHTYSYVLAARDKTMTAASFITILSGTHSAVVQGNHPVEGLGNGNFTIDWTAAQALPEHDTNVGSATFTYARQSWAGPVTISVAFANVRDDVTSEIYNATYAYDATPGSGGTFEYVAHQDALPGPGPTGTATETFAIKSRWMETGAGRSDLRMTGGDAPVSPEATASECWDEHFLSVYRNLSYDPSGNWGAATSCAFATPEYSILN